MGKSEDRSIRLTPGRYRAGRDNGKISGNPWNSVWYLYYLIASLSLAFWFSSMMRLDISTGWVTAIVVFWDLWYALVFLSKKTMRILVPVTAAGVAAAVYWQWNEIWRGLAWIANTYAGYIQEHYQYSPGYLEADSEPESLIPVIAAGAAIALFFAAYSIIWKRRARALILMTLVLLCARLTVNQFPQPVPAVTAVLAAYGITCMKSRGGRDASGCMQAKAGICGLLLAGAVALISYFVISPPLTERMIALHPDVQDFQNRVEARLGNALEDSVFQGNSPFGNWQGMIESGALSNQVARREHVTALRVTAGRRPDQAIYFKGFIGGVYQGKYWQEISDENFNAAAESWNIYEEGQAGEQAKALLQSFPYQWLGASGADQVAFDMELEEVAGDYAYLPYFSSILNGDSGMPRLLADGEALRNGSSGFEGSLIEDSPLLISPYLYSTVYAGGNEEFQGMSAYEEYVSENYMYVPKDRLDRMKEHVNGRIQAFTGANGYYPTLIEVTDMIREDLSSCSYSLNLGPLPSDVDYTENFFFDQKEGFCTHFASTAVLMYRLSGYPARYVTGYIAKPSEFRENEEGSYTAEVKDESAHAWAEVFVPQLGWVPVEMTPGFSSGGGDAAQAEIGGADPYEAVTIQTPGPTKEETPAPDRTPSGAEIPGAPETKTLERPLPPALPAVLLVLSAAATAVLVLVLRRMWICMRRNKKFGLRNYSRAVLAIVRETEKMMGSAGYHPPEGLSDADYAKKVQEDFELLEPDEFVRFMELGEHACFSEEMLTAQEVKECLCVYHRLESYFCKKHGNLWKFWWRFIKCY